MIYLIGKYQKEEITIIMKRSLNILGYIASILGFIVPLAVILVMCITECFDPVGIHIGKCMFVAIIFNVVSFIFFKVISKQFLIIIPTLFIILSVIGATLVAFIFYFPAAIAWMIYVSIILAKYIYCVIKKFILGDKSICIYYNYKSKF